MSAQDASRRLITFGDERREVDGSRPSIRDLAMLQELSFVRREAQLEANLAYEAWRARPRREGYTVYLAAQDRADAAQDQLAGWTRQISDWRAGARSATRWRVRATSQRRAQRP